MRIGINGFFLDKLATGSGQYTLNLLKAISDIDRSNEYLVIRGPATGERWLERQLALPEKSIKTPFDTSSRQMSKLWFEQVGVPRVTSAERLDLIHYPYFAAPLACSAKVVVTIHDVIPLILEPYRGSLTVRLYMTVVSAAAKRAAAIITDSHSSKADIIKLLGIPPERIAVIYLAASDDIRACGDDQAIRNLRQKYGLREGFILYFGGLDYRKNVVTLIEAFAIVKARLGSDVQLVIVGKQGKRSGLFPDLRGVVQRLGLENVVTFLEGVPEGERSLLYQAAALFVFPSLYEGFGLPPLEAMACGTPVVCSDRSSLPEVVGNAAILVDPLRRDEIAEAMIKVLTDRGLHAELRARGLERAGMFNWTQTARRTIDVYVAAVKRGSAELCA